MKDWKSVIRGVAPTLGAALGGNVGKAALEAVSRAILGRDDAPETEIEAALAKGATFEQIAKLKEAELDFQKRLAELDVDLAKLEVQDRDSARRRQVDMHDWTPNVLAVVILIGYAVVQWRVLQAPIPEANRDIVMRTLGTLDFVLATVVGFFYGTSLGSRRKDAALAAKGGR